MKLKNLKLTNWILVLVLIVGLTGCEPMRATQVSTAASDVASDSASTNTDYLRVAKLDLPGLYCQSCALNVEETLKGMDGVVDANVDFEAKKGSIVYDNTVTSAEEFVKNAFIQSYNGEVIVDQEYTPEYLQPDDS